MVPQLQRPIVIGWKERIDLPDFGLRRVKVKIDTGARTSALSAAYYVLRIDAEGRQVVDIALALGRRGSLQISAPVVRMAKVKCTGNRSEARPVIETRLRLGPVEKMVRFTLTDRSHMLTAVILGRQALADDFLVDVRRKFLQRRPR